MYTYKKQKSSVDMLNEENQYVRFVMILWRGDKIIPILYGGGHKTLPWHGRGVKKNVLIGLGWQKHKTFNP